MQSLMSRPVFEVGAVRYSWEDVALFATLTGQWPSLIREIHEGIACLRRWELAGADEYEEQIEAFASEFRYDRNLIAAEEIEAWLRERHLTTADWMAWVSREVLRRAWAAQLDEIVNSSPLIGGEIATSLPTDLVCSVRGRDWATHLAECVATTASVRETEGWEPVSAPRTSVDQIAPELPSMDSERARVRLAELASLQDGFARFRAIAAPPAVIQRELDRHRLDWIQIHCQVIKFASEALAREAALCVREDRLPIERVAADAHARVEEKRFHLGDLDAEIRPWLLAGKPSDLIGPVSFEGHPSLFLMLEKLLPNEDSPELQRQVEQKAIARTIADQTSKRVKWLDR